MILELADILEQTFAERASLQCNVPGPNPSFLVGNLGSVIFQKQHIGLLANKWYKKFRTLPYVGYYKVFKPAIMVNDTELVKNILINDFGSFYSNDISGSDDPQDIGSGNPFTQQDEQKWKTGRAAMASLFSASKLTGHTLGSFVDGYETSSTSMSFAMWHLARNPDIQERLYEDISEVLQKHGNEFSYEAINEMEYLNMVMQETMRLNTIILSMHRKCRKPYTLPQLPGQEKPFVIQPGTPVLIPVYAIHHDPEFYPDPYVFNPLRFTEEERKNRPRCAYLPFGEGPRLCVGKNLGVMQFKFGIASIIKNFKILESPNCKPVEIDPRSPLLLQTVNRLLEISSAAKIDRLKRLIMGKSPWMKSAKASRCLSEDSQDCVHHLVQQSVYS
ncbi:cytochrome P450 6j1-like [Phlebotomus papatasi]|uniref:cytochrome P450 6j1-like n=1 Tax=Phlebotomus papatasi TaxID=29031 RepID=UPI00248421E0|nr:cytochrome P450 6j1-like [Phlebotomus papatasi]